jgi:hypothetical protein
MPKPSSSADYNFSPTGSDRAGAQKNYITDAARLFTPVHGPRVIFGAYSVVYVVPPPKSHLPVSPGFPPANSGMIAPSLTGAIRLAVTLGQDAYDHRYITLVHETGHLFDLPDLYFNNAEDSKAGPWDIMSDTFRAASFLGWHRHKNGWLDASRILYISQTTPGWDVTLSPLSGSCGTSMVVLPIDNPAKPSKVFVVELAPPILGRVHQGDPRPAKGVLVYTVDATIRDMNSPLVVIPKTAESHNDVYGHLCDAAYDVGDHISVPIGTVSLAVKVNQKIGDCYNVTISYSRF